MIKPKHSTEPETGQCLQCGFAVGIEWTGLTLSEIVSSNCEQTHFKASSDSRPIV